MPAPVVRVHHGTIAEAAVLFGICARCDTANGRLPASTRQKRLNAAARLAASDEDGRYYTVRFGDPGAAKLAAHMLASKIAAVDAADALGWK